MRLATLTKHRKYIVLCVALGGACFWFRTLNEFRILWAETRFEVGKCSPCDFFKTTVRYRSDITWPGKRVPNARPGNITTNRQMCSHHLSHLLGKIMFIDVHLN